MLLFGSAVAQRQGTVQDGQGFTRSVRVGTRSRSESLVELSRYLDAIVIAWIFVLVLHRDFRLSRSQFFATLLLVPCWMLLLRYFGIYQSHRVGGLRALIRQLVSAQLLGGVIYGLTAVMLWGQAGLAQIGKFLAFTTVLLVAQKAVLRCALTLMRRRGLDHRKICIIGDWPVAGEVAEECVHHPEWGLDIVCVGVGPAERREYYSFPNRGFLGLDLEQLLCSTVIDEFIIPIGPNDSLTKERSVIALCEQYGVLGRLLPLGLSSRISDSDIAEFHGNISFAIGGLRQNSLAVVVKRAVDLVLGCIFLLALSPIMLVAAVLVKLSSPGPIIFSQLRAGLRGRPFKMYKFRSMVDGAEVLARTMTETSNIVRGPIFKDPRDWRVTPIGRVLRRFSIDELPQLWNVARGDMSLVGPRPLPLKEAQSISGTFRKRFSMRPGITCFWQVNGRSDVGYTEWMDSDVRYIENWSLGLDVSLMLRTLPAILLGRGAY
jgi:exopolysaccharide biosynthesis polyprenyl glycosylphosphotransferase